ncbi:hypothetical protein D3C86_2173070 [compost metagenome]
MQATERRAAKLHHTFGNGIAVIVELGAEGVEKFVHGDELRTFQVPVRLLGHQCKVDHRSKRFVQNTHHR